MHIRTRTGFECECDPNKFNNMRVIDALAELDKGNPLALPTLLDLVFDKPTKDSLYKHCENDDKQVPIDKLVQEVIDIFSYQEKTKN